MIIADDAVYAESLAGGGTYTSPATVDRTTVRYACGGMLPGV
jgi:hypothetical protein